jgi:hypothetical protein
MMKLTRVLELPQLTIGHLQLAQWRVWTLEPPWQNNRQRVSCIPNGVYPCRAHLSPKHGECIAIDRVPGRDNILVHSLNLVKETQGCIGVGRKVMLIDGHLDLMHSRPALVDLMKMCEDLGVNTLTVESIVPPAPGTSNYDEGVNNAVRNA